MHFHDRRKASKGRAHGPTNSPEKPVLPPFHVRPLCEAVTADSGIEQGLFLVIWEDVAICVGNNDANDALNPCLLWERDALCRSSIWKGHFHVL